MILGEFVAQAVEGGEAVTIFDLGAQAVDELVQGVIGDAGPVFDVRINCVANHVLGDDFAFFRLKKG